MPLPFILGAAAVALGGVGAKKMYDAHNENERAAEINTEAEETVSEARARAKLSRKGCAYALADLGQAKIDVLNGSVEKFVNTFGQLHNIDLSDSVGMEELKNLHFDQRDFTALQEMRELSMAALQSGVNGVGLGALTAFGAYSGTMAFGAASTGTAIASLGGAAATNAPLAFLGGGSLAAGGLGIAGGMAVLGGIVAAPALAIMGFTMEGKAKANKEAAYANRAQARKISEEIRNATMACNAIADRANMFRELLRKVESDVFFPLLARWKIRWLRTARIMQSTAAGKKKSWRRTWRWLRR